ncbi:hypothetical protein ACQKNC_11245 [Lysinibacillus sp. NPDC094177]|uniref:hypothetical protein n=1 Tax=Lysinibacillus sp. NPDC094177 TaxID=3390580 RepID=UPI003D020799
MTSPIQKRPVMNPEDMNVAFVNAYNSNNIENLLALYEQNSILINPNGGKEQGINHLRFTLENLLQLQGTIVSKNTYIAFLLKISLYYALILSFIRWTMTGDLYNSKDILRKS